MTQPPDLLVQIETNQLVLKRASGKLVAILPDHATVNEFVRQLQEKATEAYGVDYSDPQWDD